MQQIRYRFGHHGSFVDEWKLHKKCSEWWYSTGYLNAEDGAMYGFQYTLVKANLFGLTFWIAMEALTDLKSGKHYYNQTMLKGKGKPTVTEKSVSAMEVELLGMRSV